MCKASEFDRWDLQVTVDGMDGQSLQVKYDHF